MRNDDRLWRPSAALNEVRRRAKILRDIREYFFAHNIIEVETPLLSAAATVDPHIQSFCTDFLPTGQLSRRFFLNTSPEFPMKRLLAAGMSDIYSLGHVFRNDEIGERHNPEFTMLEWYRLGIDHHQLMESITTLLQTVCQYELLGKYSYKQLFNDYFSVDPHTAPTLSIEKLVGKYINESIQDLTRNDCLDLLFSHIIEPELGVNNHKTLQGVFVYDYPESMSALSKVIVNEEGQRVAARFELFVNGLELANGYLELTDSLEQVQRFNEDVKTRKKLNLHVYPYDKALIEALEHGLPTCSGVALGVDRLHMLLIGSHDIKDVLAFDFNRS